METEQRQFDYEYPQKLTVPTEAFRRFSHDSAVTLAEPEDKIKCTVCPMAFETMAMFLRHRRDHSRDKFSCHMCPTECDSVHSIMQHLESHGVDTSKPLPSPTPKTCVSSDATLSADTSSEYFECGCCECCFQDRFDLMMHYRESHYQCPGCHIWCELKRDLDVHLKLHHKRESHVMKKCRRQSHK